MNKKPCLGVIEIIMQIKKVYIIQYKNKNTEKKRSGILNSDFRKTFYTTFPLHCEGGIP